MLLGEFTVISQPLHRVYDDLLSLGHFLELGLWAGSHQLIIVQASRQYWTEGISKTCDHSEVGMRLGP